MRLAKTVLQRIRVTDDVGWFDASTSACCCPTPRPPARGGLAQQVCDRVAKRGGRPARHDVQLRRRRAPRRAAPTVIRQTDENVMPEAKAG